MKKVKLKRKGFMDVSELDALQKCYGKKLGSKDYRKYVLIPALLMASFALALTHFWWVSLVCGIYGAVYGFKIILPKSIKREYELKSLNERNRFINSLTQILTDNNKITLTAIEMAKDRTEGELNEDISILCANLEGADRQQVQEAFKELSDKYERDVLFRQYLEQVETAFCEGREGDIETIKQLKTYHNDTIRNTDNFIHVKEDHYKGLKLIVALIGVIILIVTFAFGFDVFHEAFSRSLIGWIFGGSFYLILIFLMKSFFKIYFDDDIMSVGKYRMSAEQEEDVESEEKPLNKFLQKTRRLWLSMVGEENYKLLTEMNNSDSVIIRWQSKQVFKYVSVFIYAIILFLIFNQLFILMGGMALASIYFYLQRLTVKSMYNQYRFERQLEFAKFSRLVIPHLKLKRNGGNLYGVFEKILPRLDKEQDRILLMNLMQDMIEYPNEIQPFITYGEKASGTDKAILFMNTVYDIRQGSSDMSVIEEMDEMMSLDLMETIDKIIQYKEKKFVFFSTKLAMSVIVFFIGVAASFLWHQLQSSGFFNVLSG